MTNNQYILGVACFGNHDSSVALLCNGQLLVAAEEERFSRKKFDRSFPKKSLDFCLKFAGISIEDISDVGFFWQPWKGVGRRLFYLTKGLPGSFSSGSKNAGVLFDLFFAEFIFRKQTNFKGAFHFLDHHLTHASSVYFSSGLEQSSILSVDGSGEKITTWLGFAEGEKFTELKTVYWPNSLGHVYAAVTQYLGFNFFSDEYKVMALASFGRPRFLDHFRKIIKITREGVFEVDLKYFSYQFFKKKWFSDFFVKTFGPERLSGQEIKSYHLDVAASLQKRIEEVLIHLSSYVRNEVGSENLCLSGGVLLNAVAVGKISESGLFKKVVTNSVSGDSGCALGSAYYVDRALLKNQHRDFFTTASLGVGYSDDYIGRLLLDSNLYYKKIESPPRVAAQLLSQGLVIGWFQGRAEFGQRALGNRSILADPRDRRNIDLINKKIKFREPFRPFAPAILEDFQKDYFDYLEPVPFMTEAHQVKKEKRHLIPAVIHIDGTARLQTVVKLRAPLFYDLIFEFYKLTNIPVVLNTSFNVNQEPIVNSPGEAVQTFLKTDLDALVLGGYLVTRNEPTNFTYS